jgi:hypothetical protein
MGRVLEAGARAAEALIRIEALRRMEEAMRSLPGRTDLSPEVVAWALGASKVTTYPSLINPNGQAVYYDPQTNRYLVRNTREGTGYWIVFDAQGRVIGTANEGLISVEPSARLRDDELEKIWQNAPNIPPEMPPPVLPGRPIESPRKPEIEAYPRPEPRKPEIIPGPQIIEAEPSIEWFPRPEIELPTIYESRSKDRHHNIPQFLWNPNRKSGLPPKYKFRKSVREFFDAQITKVPQEVHWDLHDKYNAVAERAMRAYLNKNKADHETEEQFAQKMSVKQAEACFKFIIAYILNPPRTTDLEEIDQNRGAREFLGKVALHVKKRKGG